MAVPSLEVRSGGDRKPIELGGSNPVTIGRHASNVIVLTDTMASRQHCVVENGTGGYRVRDLNSRNGTRVNGRPVKQHELHDGDVIQIGQVQIVFTNPDEMVDLEPEPVLEDLEALTEADLVEEEDEPIRVMPSGGGAGKGRQSFQELSASLTANGDYEQVLTMLADSMPEKPFGESDIALINARGDVVHKEGQPRKAGPREAVDVLRLILLICFRSRGTDIHIEPRNETYNVRVRVDGTMVDLTSFEKAMGVRLSALVKVLSDIDISQKSTIQEGHFAARVPGRRVDYRVSFAPSVFGQKLVIRVLDTSIAPVLVPDLNLPKWMEERILDALEQDAGMLLVCGPTGSGKTTTLYALVRSMDINARNVVTIEDPVEIQLEGVTQLPVDESEGKSFLTLLRSVLRQDPDAILVGEIRDQETARTAMQAAITGHLVFSTVHTKDTAGTIFRLLDLGVEPYLVAQGLHLVIAQRLVRQLCPYCKVPAKPTPEQIAKSGLPPERLKRIFEPVGCARCLGTGFSGRRAIFELLSTTEELRDVILKSPTIQEIKDAVKSTKFVSLAETGFELVAEGVVAFSEIERAASR